MKWFQVALLTGILVSWGPSPARTADDDKPQSQDKPEATDGPKEAEQRGGTTGKGDRDKPESLEDVGAESASHAEVDPLDVEFGTLTALKMHTDGNLLACDAKSKQIKVICPEGNLVATIQLEFAPEAIDVAADGAIYCGGEGRLAKLKPSGEVIQTGKVPEKAESSEEQPKRAKSRKRRISGIALCGETLMVAVGAGGGRGSRSQLFRLDLQFQKAKLITEDLRACCQRCDLVAKDGVFYLAENTAHRIVRYDVEGNVLGKWGQQSRTELQGFGSCCNPMNLCFGPKGMLYTAESGMARVKRYTPEGKFLALVGYVGTDRFRQASGLASSCSNIGIAVAADGNRVFVIDIKKNMIRVLEKKTPPARCKPEKEEPEKEEPEKEEPEKEKPEKEKPEKEKPEKEKPEKEKPEKEKPEKEKMVDVGAESASHAELDPLKVEFKRLSAMQLNHDGNLLACDVEAKQIKVIGPEGNQIDTIELAFGPEAIDVAADGTIYCGGHGQLAKLDPAGKVLHSVKAPEKAEAPVSETSRRRAKSSDVTLRLRVSGIAVTEKDVFVAFGSGWSRVSTSKLFRFDRELENPQLLAEGIRGCCQRCDLVTDGESVYLAENSVHRIVRYDRDGKVLGKWGKKSRDELEGFGACCNPMNLGFDAGGVLYTAESGLARLKRYSTDGKFLGLVGYLGTDRFRSAGPHAAACSNMAFTVSPDGKRLYVMDYKNNLIRVLQEKD